MHFEVRKTINAPVSRIWSILTDATKLQDGSFGVLKIEGQIRQGSKIKLWSAVHPGRAFTLNVTDMSENLSMVWRSGMPFGLFSGVRRFTLTPSAKSVEFHMREDYAGLLAPLIAKSIPDLNPSFELFANALKASSEGVAL